MFKQSRLKTRACLKINVNARAPKSGRGDDIFEVRCGLASFERLFILCLGRVRQVRFLDRRTKSASKSATLEFT